MRIDYAGSLESTLLAAVSAMTSQSKDRDLMVIAEDCHLINKPYSELIGKNKAPDALLVVRNNLFQL